MRTMGDMTPEELQEWSAGVRRSVDAELRLARARFVAEHWHKAITSGGITDWQMWHAHPLCMVLAALDGEADPVQCGIDADARDEWPT